MWILYKQPFLFFFLVFVSFSLALTTDPWKQVSYHHFRLTISQTRCTFLPDGTHSSSLHRILQMSVTQVLHPVIISESVSGRQYLLVTHLSNTSASLFKCHQPSLWTLRLPSLLLTHHSCSTQQPEPSFKNITNNIRALPNNAQGLITLRIIYSFNIEGPSDIAPAPPPTPFSITPCSAY